MRRVLTVALVAAAATGACQAGPEPPVAHVPSVADSAEQVMFDFSSIITNQGIERGTMTADTAFVFNDQTRFDFRHVHVNFRTETGEPQGTMRADSGRYDMRSEVLQGWGHVVITTTTGERLETPQIRYDQAGNVISSDTSFVLRTTDGNTNTGIGFTADPNLNHFNILRAARGSGIVTVPKH